MVKKINFLLAFMAIGALYSTVSGCGCHRARRCGCDCSGSSEEEVETTTTTTTTSTTTTTTSIPCPAGYSLTTDGQCCRDATSVPAVNLCFLVDLTGSMGAYIYGIQNSITDIVSNITALNFTLNLAFIGYRDYDAPISEQFTIQPFTSDVAIFQDFLDVQNANYGGDFPEDVCGGLNKMLNLTWPDPSTGDVNMVFHIADAEGHGTNGDVIQPGMCDEIATAPAIFGEILAKRIQYFFGRILSYTDVMIEEFSKVYGENITQFDILNANNILNSVVQAANQSISETECVPLATPKHLPANFAQPRQPFIPKHINYAILPSQLPVQKSQPARKMP